MNGKVRELATVLLCIEGFKIFLTLIGAISYILILQEQVEYKN